MLAVYTFVNLDHKKEILSIKEGLGDRTIANCNERENILSRMQ
ncbi:MULTISPECIES: hypothetical protein [Nostocales]|uniref:Transposase n=2 Tax=Nostocales TaxID=1161 RepID=A0ABW8WNE7_9CYAN|nr:hypothetical protein [Tolypothrix bouteillei]